MDDGFAEPLRFSRVPSKFGTQEMPAFAHIPHSQQRIDEKHFATKEAAEPRKLAALATSPSSRQVYASATAVLMGADNTLSIRSYCSSSATR